jgi:benzil reductase ((S)-benzoin forming)
MEAARIHKTAYIVTGTTRGIGRALADKILRRGHMLYCISRAPEMPATDRRNYTCDLRDAHAVSKVMHRLMHDVSHGGPGDVVLVNNAGMLNPIGSLENHESEKLAQALSVNLTAPAMLMSIFIRQSLDRAGSRRIINITSGAALQPYAGWSLYCAAKAGLNMLTRCAALEQTTCPNGVSVVAVAPGVVNTDMQRLIRTTGESDFPSRPRFIKLKEEGLLEDPARVAGLILDLDAGGKFQSGGIYDLRMVQRRNGELFIEAVV